MVFVYILLDFKGLAGNADPASPWISPMGRMGRGFFLFSFCSALVCFGRAFGTRACARGEGLSHASPAGADQGGFAARVRMAGIRESGRSPCSAHVRVRMPGAQKDIHSMHE